MADAASTYSIEPLDILSATDESLRPVAELALRLEEEIDLEQPRASLAIAVQRLRGTNRLADRFNLIARFGADVVARATVSKYPWNERLRETSFYVDPAHRRRGLGRALLARGLESIGEGAGFVLTGVTDSRVSAGEEFARSIGARAATRNSATRLDLSSVDRRLVNDWASLDLPGLRIIRIEGETPEDLLPRMLAARDAMNRAAPREALEPGLRWGDRETTAEMQREIERASRASGRLRRVLLCVDDGTGDTVGFTEADYDPRTKDVVHQRGTAIAGPYQGRGVAKWLKARMLTLVKDEWPDARWVLTGTALSNAAMSSINQRLGYRFVAAVTVWQLDIDTARRSVVTKSG
jgi:GNAT superfamily N-acetyltransferase